MWVKTALSNLNSLKICISRALNFYWLSPFFSILFLILHDTKIFHSSFSYFFKQVPTILMVFSSFTCFQSLMLSIFSSLLSPSLSLPFLPLPIHSLNIHQASTHTSLQSIAKFHIKPSHIFNPLSLISQSIAPLGHLTHILAVTITSFLPCTVWPGSP